MKQSLRLILPLTLLIASSTARAAGHSQEAQVFMWDQFVEQYLKPNPNQPQRIEFSGPAWICACVQPLSLTLEQKVQLANQIWIAIIFSSK